MRRGAGPILAETIPMAFPNSLRPEISDRQGTEKNFLTTQHIRFPANLSELEKRKLLSECAEVVKAAWNFFISLEDIKQHIFTGSDLFLLNHNSKVVGFCLLDRVLDCPGLKKNERFYYFSGVVVHPQFRGGKNIRIILKMIRELVGVFGHGNRHIVLFRTQDKRVVRFAERFFERSHIAERVQNR